MVMNCKEIILTAGGTGGHVFPALAMAKKFCQEGYKVHFFTDLRGVGYITDSHDLQVHIVPVMGLGKTSLLLKIYGYFSLLPSLLMCIYGMLKIKPLFVMGFGGYPAFPCLLAAKLTKTAIVLHEQNSFIGRVNRYFIDYSKALLLGFETTKNLTDLQKNKSFYVGVPVRQAIHNVRHCTFMQSQEKFKILVLGGSQGASVFAQIIPKAMELLPDAMKEKIILIQQCRSADFEHLKNIYDEIGIEHSISEFIDDVDEQLKDTSLIISRAGASTVAESIASARPALLVPLPSAMENHQFFNADYLAEKGGAWAIDQNQLTAQKLADFIEKLIANPATLRQAHACLMSIDNFSPVNRCYEVIKTQNIFKRI